MSGVGGETDPTLRLAGARGRTRQHLSDTSTRQRPDANTPGRVGSDGPSRAHNAPFSFAALTRRRLSPPSPAQTTLVRSPRRPQPRSQSAPRVTLALVLSPSGRGPSVDDRLALVVFEQNQAIKVAHELVHENGLPWLAPPRPTTPVPRSRRRRRRRSRRRGHLARGLALMHRRILVRAQHADTLHRDAEPQGRERRDQEELPEVPTENRPELP